MSIKLKAKIEAGEKHCYLLFTMNNKQHLVIKLFNISNSVR